MRVSNARRRMDRSASVMQLRSRWILARNCDTRSSSSAIVENNPHPLSQKRKKSDSTRRAHALAARRLGRKHATSGAVRVHRSDSLPRGLARDPRRRFPLLGSRARPVQKWHPTSRYDHHFYIIILSHAPLTFVVDFLGLLRISLPGMFLPGVSCGGGP